MPTAAGVDHDWHSAAVISGTGRTLLGAAVGLVLTGASFVGSAAVVAVLAIAAIGLALGWPRLLGLPSPTGSSVVIALTGVFAIGAAVAVGTLVPLIAVLGFAVVAAFLHEMVRRDGRPRLTESVSGTVTGAVAASSAAGWVVVSEVGPPAVVITAAGAALTVSALAALLPLERAQAALVASFVGLGVGVAMADVLTGLGTGTGAVLGAGAGLFTSSVRAFFDHYPSSGRPSASSAIGALPVCALGVPSYAFSLLFV